jgi:hypothetical protein
MDKVGTVSIAIFGLFFGTAMVGGFAAWLSEREQRAIKLDGAGEGRNSWIGCLVYLVGALVSTFSVPLLLRLADSALMDHVLRPGSEGARASDVWVLAGFCLIAAFSSKAFIQSLSERVIELAESASRTANAAKEQAQESSEAVSQVEEVVENLSDTDDVPQAVPMVAAGSSPSGNEATPEKVEAVWLSNAELEVLHAFINSAFSRRTMSNVSKDLDLPLALTRRLISGLVDKGMLDELISSKTGRHLYRLTLLGRASGRRPVP